MKIKILYIVLLLVSLFLTSIFYQFDKIIKLPPQSLHAWRQTDCASQALNYYQNGMNFFKPELHSLISDNGSSGYSVEEFPIIFYSVAFLYKVFGYNPLLYRLLTFVFFILGVIAYYLMFNLFWKNRLASLFASLLLFTSTTFAFYSINFICNVPSISIMLIAWVLFFLYYLKQEKKYYLVLSLLFFGFAVLLKISEALSFCSIGCIWILEQSKIMRFGKNNNTLLPKWVGVMMLFISVLIFEWYKWAHNYNLIHQQTYYSFQINPIWSLSTDIINIIFNTIKHRWVYDYFTLYCYILYCSSIIYVLFNWRKCNQLLKTISILLFLGSISYLVLFYCNLNDHDYYMLSAYITFWFFLLTAGELLFRNYSKRVTTVFAFLLILVFTLSIFPTRNRLNQRYFNWEYEFPQTSMYKVYYNLEPTLQSMGIKRTDKIISIPDFSICYTLYLMNRQGWTGYSTNDSSSIANHIEKGAKYLIIAGEETCRKEFVKSYINKPIGQVENIYFFKLEN